MARAPDPKIEEAKAMYLKGCKLVEIASQLDLPEGTVRRWKCTHKWDNERSDKKSERSHHKKRGAPYGNKNGKGAPKGSKRAEKFGFYSKYLPEETKEIFDEIDKADPLDLLWDQIKFSYTAIIRAQHINYVQNAKDDSFTGTNILLAGEKQANFLAAQARAQDTLSKLIKQYDEMLHNNWELATEEQKARIENLRAKVNKTDDEIPDDGFLDALNASAEEDWSDED